MSVDHETRAGAAETVAWLCAQGSRRSGSDVERRVAAGLADRLSSPRRRVAIEPVYVHPQWQLVHLAHCGLAIAGSLLAGVEPALGFGLVLIAATSFYLDLNGRAYLLRRLFFRRASQNIVSPPLVTSDRARVIITAGYDAGLTGAVYNDWATAGFERLRRRWPGANSPGAVIFWAMALLLPALGLRMVGVDQGWVAALQLPQTLTLMVAGYMLGEIGLSPTSPGAAHNGSGVAAALEAVRVLDDEPPAALEVGVLFATANEAGREGFSRFLRAHREQLPRDRTWFVDLSSAGAGTARYVVAETPALVQPLDPDLLDLCAALMAGGAETAGGSEEPARLDHGPPGAAGMAAGRGYPAIALTAREGSALFPPRRHMPADRPETVDPHSISAVSELAVDLIRLLDRQLSREAAGGAS